jgi:hypothetical protein
MLKAIFSSEDAERVLFYIIARDQGYGREIADFWDTTQTGVKRQLERFEAGGILTGTAVGRTRVYSWNPRYPFLPELKALMTRAVTFLPEGERAKLLGNRRRPRRQGKPA